MKVEKFKVLLYLKKSGTDKSGKAPIMGRITVNRTMAQFGCKLSCRPDLWNARESRLDGKSREGYYYMRKTKDKVGKSQSPCACVEAFGTDMEACGVII